ncbi:MAG: TetR/AcrR family transcriptional regulator, partial [Acidimicrobiia bacterium]
MRVGNVPPQPNGRLDRETVVSTAAEIVDSEGYTALTLARLAERLNRHVSSLYNHVDSLDALRHELTVRGFKDLGDALWRAALGRTGREGLLAIAEAYRAYATDHIARFVGPLLADRQLDDDVEYLAALKHVAEPLRAVMASLGVPERDLARAHQLFSSAILGFVFRSRLSHDPEAPHDERGFRLLVDMLADGIEAELC